MNLLINLTTLKKGGGQNVALNFLECLNAEGNLNNFTYAVVKNSTIHEFLNSKGIKKIVFMPRSPILRILKEFFMGNYLLSKYKIDIIYTYFGVGFYPKKIRQVSGSADSNIYFPEIKFWSDYKGFKLFFKKLIDYYRIWGLKRMTAVIFENKVMEERGKKFFGLKHTAFIMPSINSSSQNNVRIPCLSNKKKFSGLFFCSWQKNKNYMLIPDLAAEFKRRNIEFHFIFTAPIDHSKEYYEFITKIKHLNVENLVHLIGTVEKDKISSLYNEVDFVFLLSKLESFSNNIIESWYFKRVMIISNELWSKSICGDAAVYVNRNDVVDIVSSVIELLQDEEKYYNFIEKGTESLSNYPSIKDRTIQEFKYLQYIYENN